MFLQRLRSIYPSVVDTQKRLAIVNGNKNMKQVKKSSIATALGAVVIGSLATVSVQASASPFGAQQLEAGYMTLAQEGKCGEGKCGGDKEDKSSEGKCGEGKCGGDKAAKAIEGKCGEGKCGGDKAAKATEGKCGEGKCGGDTSEKATEGKCGEGKCGGQA